MPMQYWSFFPTGEDGWGHMPVWGFADVVASDRAGGGGRRALLRLLADRQPSAHEAGARDAARLLRRGRHRLALTSAYNQYTRVAADAAYRAADENYQMLLRPLFITSFMLADFLQDNGFFGAKRLVVSSASSKTAYGTAFCLEGLAGVELVAFTSARQRGLRRGPGLLPPHRELRRARDAGPPTCRRCTSTSPATKRCARACTITLARRLVHDCFAGSAQNTHFLRDTGLPGPEPKFYFAPVQIRKRNADWGHAEVNRKFNEAQLAFIRRVSDARKPWMRLSEHAGFQAAQGLIADLHAGRIDPSTGHVVVLELRAGLLQTMDDSRTAGC